MKFSFLVFILALSCSASETDRQICYVRADLDADLEIQKRCIDKKFKFSDCPEHDAILLDLQAMQKRCP